jgi:hypothetical protein
MFKMFFLKRCVCRQVSMLPDHIEVHGNEYIAVEYASCTFIYGKVFLLL